MEDVLNQEAETTQHIPVVAKILLAVLAVTAGSLLNSSGGALLAGIAVYLAFKTVRNTSGHDRWLLITAGIIGLNVSLTTLWYGVIGNYVDPELAPIWSKFECDYSGGSDVYCPSYVTDKRDKILAKRGVTTTIVWWATGSALNQGEPVTHHNVQGLAITYWFPEF